MYKLKISPEAKDDLVENIRKSDIQYYKLKHLYSTLTKKQKDKINKFLEENLFELLE